MPMPSSAPIFDLDPAPTTTAATPSKRREPTERGARVCFALAALVAIFCAGLHLRLAFRTEFLVEDDARQHVFWAARYLDPSLFPGDPVADYFQTVAPRLYRACYWLPAAFGVDPLTWSKILPALLGVASSLLCYRLTTRFFRPPADRGTRAALTGLLAVALFNLVTWIRDDVCSATPRAFFPLLFLAFFHGWWRGERRGQALALFAVALQGLLYPGAVFTSVGLAAMGALRFGGTWQWRRPLLPFSRRRADWVFLFAVLAVAGVTLGIFSRQTTAYGPVLRAVEARQMPELSPEGRSDFFDPDLAAFWLTNARSGLVTWPLRPGVLWLGFALPLALLLPGRRRPGGPNHRAGGAAATAMVTTGGLPGAAEVDAAQLLPALGRLLAVCLGLFLLAHLTLFRLHLPSRYTDPTLRALLPSLSALTLVLVADGAWRWTQRGTTVWRRRWRLAAAVAVGTGLVAVKPRRMFLPKHLPMDFFAVGTQPDLYQYLRAQPKQTRVATLSDEASLLPAFGRCAVLADREFAIPYHLGYYRPFRERVRALLAAHYTEDARQLAAFADAYGVTHFLVERDAFAPGYLKTHAWLRSYEPEFTNAQRVLQEEEGRRCVLADLAATSPVFHSPEFALVSVESIRQWADTMKAEGRRQKAEGGVPEPGLLSPGL